jgi:predicted dehydrogenase
MVLERLHRTHAPDWSIPFEKYGGEYRMKALFIGLGSIGQRHVRNLRALLGSQVEIMAFRVRGLPHVITEQLEIEQGSRVEEKFQIKVYGDLEEALDARPDIAFICNPNSLHIPVALLAARAGCHLFIEKPLSHDCEGIEDLIRIVEIKKKVAFVGYQMRFHPCLQRLQTLIQQQAVGRLMAVRIELGEYMPGWHRYEDYRETYAAKKEFGGGVILAQSHELDYAYWLFGLPRRVFSIGGHLSGLEIDVEDVASILMECEFHGRVVPVHIQLDLIQRPPSRTCQVVGDEGKILVDLRTPCIQVFNARGELSEAKVFEQFQRNQLFLEELQHFLDCIRGHGSPLVTLHDGLASLRMALAAKASLTSGKVLEPADLASSYRQQIGGGQT